MKSSPLLGFLFAISWILLIAFSWSSSPYWQDAQLYTQYIASDRLVGQPPGYLFFMLIAHFFHFFIPSPYAALQAQSFSLALLSFLILFPLLHRATANARIASYLTVSCAFSWGVLVIAQIGTSHSSDLFTVSLLLLACLPFLRSQSPSPQEHVFLGLAIVITAGLRFTTLLFHVPLLAFVTFYHCLICSDRTARLTRAFSITKTYLLAAVIILTIQLLVIHLYGGWQAYSEYAAYMHQVNRPSSILLSGITTSTLLNIFRALFWYALAAGPILLFAFFSQRRCLQDPVFLIAIISSGSVLAFSAAYIAPHPGYFAAALPGIFLAAAKIWENKMSHSQATALRWIPVCAAVFGFLLFVSLKPIPKPNSPSEAALNGLLLQYGLYSAKRSIFYNISEWLIIGGFENLVPKDRLQIIKDHGRYLPPKPE